MSVLLLAQVQSAAAQERYEDGTFEVDDDGMLIDWSTYGSFDTPADAPGGGAAASAPRGGGNPLAFFRPQLTSVTVETGESWAVWGIHINDQAVYDPSTSGPLERIDFDFDSRVPPGGRGSRAIGLAVQQDGFLWAAIGRRVLVTGPSWTPTTISGLTGADFTPHIWAEQGQPETPDFSEDGSPVSFGVVQGQSCPVTSDCSAPPTPIEVDVDNWVVTVNDTALTLELSLGQVAEPGELEPPFELTVSATVRNASADDVSDIEVEFRLPKEALAAFSVPEPECGFPDPPIDEAVVTVCAAEQAIGPSTSDTVRVPSGVLSDPEPAVISVAYAGVVPDRSQFTYRAEIVSLSGRDEQPGDVLEDEVVLTICNPTGNNPVAVETLEDCDDLPTGGTGGDGGAAGAGGTGGNGSTGSSSGGCGCYTVSANGSNPWLPFLCLVAFAIWRRLGR